MLSEQVVEATHSKWSNIWDNYKVRHLHREEYGDKILRKEFFKNSIFPPYLPKLRNSKKNYKCNKEFMQKFDNFIDSKVNINLEKSTGQEFCSLQIMFLNSNI